MVALSVTKIDELAQDITIQIHEMNDVLSGCSCGHPRQLTILRWNIREINGRP